MTITPPNPSIWTHEEIPYTFPWTNLDLVLSHEMGHGLGLLHSNNYECGDEVYVYGQNCTSIEYGNVYDVMGRGEGFGFHMNGFYKEFMGWINNSNSLNITQSGIYILNPLESSGTGGKKVAKIRALGTNKYPFYLEYRRGIGFDNGLNNSLVSTNQQGLFAYRISKDESNFSAPIESPKLLDFQPNTPSSGFFEDRYKTTLNGNTTFSDPQTGITIGPILNITPSEIKFAVTLVPTICSNEPLYLNLNPYEGMTVTPGQTTNLPIIIYNNDSITCSSSSYIKTFIVPPGWSTTQYNYPELLEPMDNELSYQAITIPSNTIPGIYTVIIILDNLTNGTTVEYPIQLTVQ